MSQNDQIKTYTKEIDNSQRIENAVWIELNRDQDERKEHIAAGLFQSGPGKILKQQVLTTIKSAKEMVVLSSFLFADEEIKQELIRTAACNVRVYMLMAAAGRLEQVPDGDSEFEKKVYEDHKRMLNALSPYVYIRSADHFHAKVVLADPFSESPSGVLLTANLTTDALERNEELAVLLDPEQAKGVAAILRCVFWEEAEHHAIDGRLASISCLNRLVAPVDLSRVYYNSKSANTLKDRVRDLVQYAENEIVFSTFGIDESHELFSLLMSKLKQGVKVKLFARYRRGKMNSVFRSLAEAGAEIYGFTWLHAKAFLIDGSTGFLMTANLEPHGMDSGFELGVDLSLENTRALSELFIEWERHHQYRYHATTRLGDLSDRFYQFESGSCQFVLKELKAFHEIAPIRKIVATANALEESLDDFQELISRAKSSDARRVKLTVEKIVAADKK